MHLKSGLPSYISISLQYSQNEAPFLDTSAVALKLRHAAVPSLCLACTVCTHAQCDRPGERMPVIAMPVIAMY